MTVGRFAPSPSGRMHLGNLMTALLAWLSAKQKGGRIVLRIEDLDTGRCLPEYARQIETDFRALGLFWDEGGSGGGPNGPYFQSRRGEIYAAALKKLEEQGLTYPCFCTRAQLHAASAPHKEDGQSVYPGTCRELTADQVARRQRETGRCPALRLRVPERELAFTDGRMGSYREHLARDCGDFLLRRSDGLWAYQLAVVADDAAMGVTEVVRGSDLLSSTPRQLLLYELLGLPAPRFIHGPLLLAADGRRLSKRERDMNLDALLARSSPRNVIGTLAYLAGFHPSALPCTPQDLLAEFSWEKVPKTDLIVPEGLF